MSARTPIPAEHLEQFRAHIKSLPLRDHLLIEIELSTGFRISEVLAITVGQVCAGPRMTDIRKDLTLERRSLKFGRSALAHKMRARRVPIPPHLKDLLAEFLFARFQFATLTPELAAAPLIHSRKGEGALRRWQAINIVREACRGAGLDPDGAWGTHSLRKNFARLIYQGTGHDIDLTRVAMGHSSIGTTQRYLSTTEDEAFDAIAKLQGAASLLINQTTRTGGLIAQHA